jgi:hypothetical protein
VKDVLNQGATVSEALITPPAEASPASYLPSLAQVEESRAYGWSTLIPAILFTRTLIFAVGVMSVLAVHSVSQINPHNGSGYPWAAFDSHFYKAILLSGYPPGPGITYQIAFFPLFPYASRLVLPVFEAIVAPQTAPYAALVAFSNICSLVGLCFVYAWTRTFASSRTAFIATVLITLCPSAVFYSAGLTEGPFMMFAAITIYLLQKQRVYAAAAVCALGTACRPTAVGLAATVVLWAIYYSWNMPKGRLLLRVLLVGTVSVAGAASYQCFLWHQYHRFNAFKLAEDKWNFEQDPVSSAENQRSLKGIDALWVSDNLTVTPAMIEAQARSKALAPQPRRYSPEFFISHLSQPSAWNRVMALVLLGMLILALVKESGVSKILQVLPLIIFMMSYLPNSGLRVSSIVRYESAGIPLFVATAVWLSNPRRRPILITIAALCLGIQIYYAVLFSRGYWIG